MINTLLQVLIDDPLLDWTLSAEKLEQKQKNQARGLDNTVTTNNDTVLGELYCTHLPLQNETAFILIAAVGRWYQ